MKALLLDTRNDKHFVGDTSADLAAATGRVSYDLKTRKCTIQLSATSHLVVNPTTHVLSYGDSWEVDELVREMGRDAVAYLCRNCGFILYRSDK